MNIDEFLALPYEKQKDALIISLRSLGKIETNRAWRDEVFKRDPELLHRFYNDPEIKAWMKSTK